MSDACWAVCRHAKTSVTRIQTRAWLQRAAATLRGYICSVGGSWPWSVTVRSGRVGSRRLPYPAPCSRRRPPTLKVPDLATVGGSARASQAWGAAFCFGTMRNVLTYFTCTVPFVLVRSPNRPPDRQPEPAALGDAAHRLLPSRPGHWRRRAPRRGRGRRAAGARAQGHHLHVALRPRPLLRRSARW